MVCNSNFIFRFISEVFLANASQYRRIENRELNKNNLFVSILFFNQNPKQNTSFEKHPYEINLEVTIIFI